ncbi:MAG: hypothetical protein DWQ31_19110 [Planctomycetota bacterium]|nr:MAG: hypothetical protein DWQ31_19110 [Planctomycetota bacterium]REJ91746.1 MAG: hypothetical protein DWQ35_13660 [Planctomycetota bacterium]REK26010.1 MAG: hypothetical protein DWQ42_10300 [Planctomycetota bacterium]REK46875.1 MAG: hypothetical protein DWQ46_05105 [Planctomycetota bacterium]
MLRATSVISFVALLLTAVGGCSESSHATSTEAAASIDKSQFLLVEEPSDAIGVMIAREDAKDKDEIVLLARIGGRRNPFIEGRSAFMVIDASMTIVDDGQESGKGQVCLDDCCTTLRKESTMLVKVVGADGKIVPLDARQLLDVNENDLVVVKGKVERGKDSFSVAATGVYVRR